MRRARLPHTDPGARHGPLYRAFVSFLGTPLAALMLPTALLETRGARSGHVRRNAVIYFHDGERVPIIASKLGAPEHPSWFHNARANPDVELGGLPFRVEIVGDEAERTRLWELADRVFPPYPCYREKAARVGRTIPILQLVPR